MHNVARFFETMQNSRVAFIGTGVTNGDIIRLFRKKDIDVTLLDRKNPEQLGKVYTEFESLGVKFCLGDSYLDSLTDYDVVFRSPGMYYHNEKLQEARKNGRCYHLRNGSILLSLSVQDLCRDRFRR